MSGMHGGIREGSGRPPKVVTDLDSKREFLKLAKSYPCMDCGGSFPPECMDFDHVRGDKLYSAACLGGIAVHRIREELAKCELVCANCHRTRTKQRRF